jgi:hypothetical protein
LCQWAFQFIRVIREFEALLAMCLQALPNIDTPNTDDENPDDNNGNGSGGVFGRGAYEQDENNTGTEAPQPDHPATRAQGTRAQHQSELARHDAQRGVDANTRQKPKIQARGPRGGTKHPMPCSWLACCLSLVFVLGLGSWVFVFVFVGCGGGGFGRFLALAWRAQKHPQKPGFVFAFYKAMLPLFLCSLLCNKEQHDVRPHTPKTKCSCSSADKSENRSARYVPLGRGEKKTTPPPEARKKLCLW